jgi:tripartite-type tricarboxylate transporter receptor subunit TctC
MRTRTIACAVALFGLVAMPALGLTQDYPNKPIHLIAAAAPGGSIDILARVLSPRLSASLGQPIVVENRAGGAGSIAAAAVASAPKDGYTLMLSASQMVAQAAAFTAGSTAKLAYDPIRDFSPVALIGYGPIVLGVSSTFPATSVDELIALVRANPGKHSFSSCGNGTPQHLAGELFNISAKIDLAHVPYRGCAPAMTDAVTGAVPVFFTVINNALPFVKSGKVRLLGVATPKRLPSFPDLPTIAESGLPGFDASPWFGVLAPVGVPDELVARLNAAVNAAVSAPDVNEKLHAMMMEPATLTPEQFSKVMRDELALWTRVVREAKIKID